MLQNLATSQSCINFSLTLLQATVSELYCQNVTANEEEKHEKEISNLIAGLTYEFKVSECLLKNVIFLLVDTLTIRYVPGQV